MGTRAARSQSLNRWGALVVAVALCFVASRSHAGDVNPRQLLKTGQESFDRGALERATTDWERAAQLFEKAGNAAGQCDALLALGNGYLALGHQPRAAQTFERAIVVAEKSHDRTRLALAKAGLGLAWSCSRQADAAEHELREALVIAHEDHDAGATAMILNNLAGLQAGQNKISDALDSYRGAIAQAQVITNRLITAKSAANAAATAARAGHFTDAEELNAFALADISRLPASHEQAFLWIRCGQTDGKRTPARAEESYRNALKIAERLGDRRAETYALGYLGELTGSIELTRQAALVAEQIPLPDALYRWQWQTGRLLRAQGDRDGAIAAYRRAIETLQPIRSDLALGSGAGRAPFRETVGALYFELADLLLRQPDAEATLREARDTIEQLKSAELEDYLRDECAGVQLAHVAPIERVSADTAVIYFVPLADRTELLISSAAGMKRFKLPVTSEQLTATVRQFRLALEKRTTNEYLVPARALYDSLIKPVRDELVSGGVRTLVFVPDRALRSVPLAALYDGEHFLVERFAVAVSPGLTLMEPKPISRARVHVLVGGVTEAVQDFPPLPGVGDELQTVANTFHADELLDRQFVLPVLRKDFSREQYQIVHFATHGEFESDASKSFILTYDGRLTLDELESLIRPGQFRGKPVELLTLSACQTAAGDDRAALGLAGVAVKAGARSALASLWFVHDQSTTMLMGEFYGRLRNEAGMTKAKALQQAQIKLISDARFGHPCYWAPFLLIGNWL